MTLVLLASLAHVAGFTQWLSLETILARREALRAWVVGHYALAALGFLAAYVGIAALAIPGSAILTLLSGFLFGRWLGSALVLTGATLGALIVFLVVRGAVRHDPLRSKRPDPLDLAQAFASSVNPPPAKGGLRERLRGQAEPLYDRLATAMSANSVEVLLFLRLVPIIPFFLVNLVAALFDIRTATFVATTFFGIMPATFIYNSIGLEIGTVQSLGGLLSPQALAALSALAGLSLLPILFKHRLPGSGKAPDVAA